MFDSIVLKNPSNDTIFKFTLLFDKNNYTTTAGLKVKDNELVSVFSGDLFIKTLQRITEFTHDLPFDPSAKVYDGLEMKISYSDNFRHIVWSNMAENNNYDKAFSIDGLYISSDQQKKYSIAANILLNEANIIFRDQLMKV